MLCDGKLIEIGRPTVTDDWRITSEKPCVLDVDHEPVLHRAKDGTEWQDPPDVWDDL